MSKRESLSRYNLIVKKLKKQAATFAEIDEYLERESEFQDANFTISKRTFQRDLIDIRTLYGIDIQYDSSKKAYYITDDEDSAVNEHLLEAFDTFNALNLSAGLSQYIHFENRKPKGTEHLYGLLHAIKNRFTIEFSYQKYWDEKPTERSAEPYALKEFKNRWYVLALDEKDKNIKSFALDRLSYLQIKNKKFKYPKDFNIEETYRYCFGIISPNNEEPKEIVLSFNAHQGKYIKSLPLHHTQEIIVDNKDELQIKLKLCISHDFIMEILQHGENVKVIKPKSLATQIKNELTYALEQY